MASGLILFKEAINNRLLSTMIKFSLQNIC